MKFDKKIQKFTIFFNKFKKSKNSKFVQNFIVTSKNSHNFSLSKRAKSPNNNMNLHKHMT